MGSPFLSADSTCLDETLGFVALVDFLGVGTNRYFSPDKSRNLCGVNGRQIVTFYFAENKKNI